MTEVMSKNAALFQQLLLIWKASIYRQSFHKIFKRNPKRMLRINGSENSSKLQNIGRGFLSN